MEPNIEKAEEIFKSINQKLLPEGKGKIVAIDAESGDYEVGATVLDAYKKAAKKFPNKKFVFKRIGFDYVYFVGAI